MTAPAGAAITVRDGQGDDLPLLTVWTERFLHDLRSASDDPWYEGAGPPDPELSRVTAQAALAAGLVLVATLDGEACGYLLARLERPFILESPVALVGHVSQVWVAPQARGRGVARALVAAIEERLRARGLRWVQLSYLPANRPAAASWTALGFEPFRVHGRKRL